jgi:hypothetical protein
LILNAEGRGSSSEACDERGFHLSTEVPDRRTAELGGKTQRWRRSAGEDELTRQLARASTFEDPRIRAGADGWKGRKQAIRFLEGWWKDSEAHENHVSG